jgi:hypothetical protein
MTANERAYQAMLEKAVYHHRPVNYADWDLLYCDRLNLGLVRIPERRFDETELPEGQAFGWILRYRGTEFLSFFSDHPEVINAAEVVARYHGTVGDSRENPHRWYFWDGKTLHDVGSYEGLQKAVAHHRLMETLAQVF